MPNVPWTWIVMGDFNVNFVMTERSYYHQGMPTSGNVKEFQECVQAVELRDAHSEGPLFTWSNHRSVGFLAKKLDQVMVNDRWLTEFPSLALEFLSPDFLDHWAGLVQRIEPVQQKHGSFKFFNFLIKHKDVILVVTNL